VLVTVESVSVTQSAVVHPEDVECVVTCGAVALTQHHVLTVAGLSVRLEIESVSFASGGSLIIFHQSLLLAI